MLVSQIVISFYEIVFSFYSIVFVGKLKEGSTRIKLFPSCNFSWKIVPFHNNEIKIKYEILAKFSKDNASGRRSSTVRQVFH